MEALPIISMDKLISPAVITSRAADRHYENIKEQHADILRSMTAQSDKVADFNMRKQSEMAAQSATNAQFQKDMAATNTQAAKDAMTFAQKQTELDIKRASLSSI